MKRSVVKLSNVDKVYSSPALDITALKDVDLDFKEGEYIVIMGPSGSGKSTLLNLLGCLDRISSGTYQLGELDISKLDDNHLSEIRSQKIGFIFQSYNLIPQLDLLENIEVPLYYQGVSEHEARAKAIEMATKMGLEKRLKHKPAELSGGQQQRVAIARSLINNPLIILADEPTGNLDSETGDEILRIIDELNEKGKTIVMVTHDEAIACRAHRIIYLKDGAIVATTIQSKSSRKKLCRE